MIKLAAHLVEVSMGKDLQSLDLQAVESRLRLHSTRRFFRQAPQFFERLVRASPQADGVFLARSYYCAPVDKAPDVRATIPTAYSNLSLFGGSMAIAVNLDDPDPAC